MIVRCDAVENYMFLRDSQLLQVVGLQYGKVGMNYVCAVFLTGAGLNNLIPYNYILK